MLDLGRGQLLRYSGPGSRVGSIAATGCDGPTAGAGGATNALMSAVLAGSAFADGKASGVNASRNSDVRRAEEMSMPVPARAVHRFTETPNHSISLS